MVPFVTAAADKPAVASRLTSTKSWVVTQLTQARAPRIRCAVSAKLTTSPHTHTRPYPPSKYRDAYPTVCNPTSTRNGNKTPWSPNFNPGTLPHNAVRRVPSIHDLILWARGPISYVITLVDNRSVATLTTTLALAGGITGRPSSKHWQPQPSQGEPTDGEKRFP